MNEKIDWAEVKRLTRIQMEGVLARVKQLHDAGQVSDRAREVTQTAWGQLFGELEMERSAVSSQRPKIVNPLGRHERVAFCWVCERATQQHSMVEHDASARDGKTVWYCPRCNTAHDDPPPVDRSQQILTSGAPVPEDRSHTELKENGQQKGYIVLTAEERAKSFVRPVRRAYIHVGKGASLMMVGPVLIKPGASPGLTDGKCPDSGWKLACGSRTTMSQDIAETYARDPYFYSGTFCVGCGKHLPLDEFVWEDTTEQVGS